MLVKNASLVLFFFLVFFQVLPLKAQEDHESCQAARQERRELCEKAASICLEVYKYDAFNQIQPCAEYSQHCAELGNREDALCSSSAEAQWKLKPLAHQHTKVSSTPN